MGKAGMGAGLGEGKEWEEEGSRARPNFQSGPETQCGHSRRGHSGGGREHGQDEREELCGIPGAAALRRDGPRAGVCPAPIPASRSSHRLSGAGLPLRTGFSVLGASGAPLGSPDEFKFHINNPSLFVDVYPE